MLIVGMVFALLMVMGGCELRFQDPFYHPAGNADTDIFDDDSDGESDGDSDNESDGESDDDSDDNSDGDFRLAWTRAVDSVPGLFPRTDFGTAVHNGKMWIISGNDDTGIPYDDIWSSTDGVNWTLVHAGEPFMTNRNPGFTAFAGNLYFHDPLTGEIHYSSDGVTWNSGGVPAIGAQYVRLVSTGETVFAITALTAEVWENSTPTNQGTWQQIDDGSAFPGGDAEDLTVALFGEYAWVVARGLGIADGVWRGAPGEGWQEMNSIGLYNREWAQMVSFEGSLWMLGGWLEPVSAVTNDVLKIDPSNGEELSYEENTPWDLRERFGALVFDNRIFLFGGVGDGGVNFRTDVWFAAYEPY